MEYTYEYLCLDLVGPVSERCQYVFFGVLNFIHQPKFEELPKSFYRVTFLWPKNLKPLLSVSQAMVR